MRLGAHIASMFAAALLFSACSKQESAPEPVAEPEPVVASEPKLDPVTGLKMTGDWEIVRASCTACHSPKLITQQRGTQNLWQFDPATEEKIITYLAENYPPSDAQRRMALSPDLMPPNPYSSE